MKNRSTLAGLAVAVALLGIVRNAHAQTQVVNYSFDEKGNGLAVGVTGALFPLQGTLAADPGPGGLSSALTYNLGEPPSLVAGDLVLLEPGGGGTISDLIRFNPLGAGGVASYPASLIFYSSTGPGDTSLADVGFPTARYPNLLTVTETGPEGGLDGLFNYTPTAGQPGFVSGYTVTYNLTSEVAPPGIGTPEPTTLATAGLGLVAAGIAAWRTRRRATSPA